MSGETIDRCGSCRSCTSGYHDACQAMTYTGVTRSGAFAEFIALPVRAVWDHAPGTDLETATLFEPLGMSSMCFLMFISHKSFMAGGGYFQNVCIKADERKLY